MKNENRKELLCFAGEGVAYAVEFSEVIEICTQLKVEKIPCLPDYFSGICHYKGTIISIVTMDRSGKMAAAEPQGEHDESGRGSVIIVVDSGQYQFGISIQGEPWISTVDGKTIEDIAESLVPDRWKEKAVYQTEKEIICQLDLAKSADALASQ